MRVDDDGEWQEFEDFEGSDSAPSAILASAGVTVAELATCASVLRRLSCAQDKLVWSDRGLRDLRKAMAPHLQQAFSSLPQKDELDVQQRNKAEKLRKRERKQRQLDADKKWKENAALRASRLAQLEALERPTSCAIRDVEAANGIECGQEVQTLRIPDGPARNEGGQLDTREKRSDEESITLPASCADDSGDMYSRQQSCYSCKVRFFDIHHFYSHFCPSCAALNFEKRHQVVDLCGRVCLVTGARVKIGFETGLKLLRMGARVIAVTRFPQDARRRYLAQQDAGEWRDRLDIRGADFRFLGGVEAFCSALESREQWLDVLINNACQTVRRPAAYYKHLVEGERCAETLHGAPTGDPQIDSAVAAVEGASETGTLVTPSNETGIFDVEDSAALSQLAVLAEDRMEEQDANMPCGKRDVHGQQLDLRSTNSWLLRLGEVSTAEAVEVFCINALAPFVLNGRLRRMLERSPHPDRYVVNVSAMEGKFYRYKQATHPHTNMAKAALNMMTRTCAEEHAKSGIFMNSVDTGWINDENPLPMARRIAEQHDFQTPIDEVDAAARILDPVLVGVQMYANGCHGRAVRSGLGGGGGGEGCGPSWGRFFKDYAPTEW